MGKKISVITLFFVFILTQLSYSQQMVVDDAVVTTYRSFQLETWYGEYESWFLPAVSPLPGTEISAGKAFDSKDSFSSSSWLFEGKYVHGDLGKDGSAIGIVAGISPDADWKTASFYLYAPYSRYFFESRSVLHVNLGVNSAKKSDEWVHQLTYGVRNDFEITDRLYFLSEVFANNLYLRGFQTGIRVILIDELLELDITYGGGFEADINYPGFSAGIAFTPSQLW